MGLIKQMQALTVQPGCLAVWGLGQMGFAVKGSGGPEVYYFDPILSNVVVEKFPEQAGKMDRTFPPPVRPEEVTNAAVVLCTHEHIDHTDPLTLGPLAKASPQARFVVSGWAGEGLDEAGIPADRRIVPEVGQPLQIGRLRVWAIPAAHYSMDHDPGKGYRFLSYQIELDGVRLFHSGDTLMTPEWLEALQKLPAAHVAIVAANGRDPFREAEDILGNLTPAEAVWVAEKIGWDVLIPGHNDLFAWNTISPGALAEAARKYHPRLKMHTLQPGELYYYVGGE